MSSPFFGKRGRGIRRAPGVMNKLELAWSQELEIQRATGQIIWWKFDSITLKLAHDTRYTPDFQVMESDGTIRFDEVKGGLMEDDAWVKLKVAAESFPFLFRLVRQKAKKDGGGWDIKEVG